MTIRDIAAIIQRQIETAPAGDSPASVAAHAAGNLAQVMAFDAPTPESALFDAVRAAPRISLSIWEHDRPGSLDAFRSWAAERGERVESIYHPSAACESHEVRFGGSYLHSICIYVRRAS